MKGKIRIIPSMLAAALCGATFVAVAGETGTSKDLSMQHKQLMKKLDANQDGVISQAEAASNPELARQFRELDRDRNQKLEKAEFARFEVTTSEDREQ